MDSAFMFTRTSVSLMDANGNVLWTHFGPTGEELLLAHRTGTCDAWCSFCYSEGCEWYAKEKQKAQKS